MPRLSVVLVAGASAHVCGGPDVELLTIDDASADARNGALDRAAGDYVWFVEPQDVLLPGALEHVLERLEAETPDVLRVHQTTVDARGRVHAGRAGAVPRAFDKVMRREHVRALGVRFRPGAYGDLPVAWPALLAAERIATAPEPGYVHIRPDGPDSPSDVFSAYDAVFAAVPQGRRAELVPAMLKHQLALLKRVPEADRREFFRQMSERYRRHRTGDEPPAAGRLGRLRGTLVERDAYRAFRLLERRRPRIRAARLRRRARDARLERHYRSRLRQPVDPNLAVFGAYWFRGYSCNPRAIYEKARELVPEVRGVWVVKAAAAGMLPPGVEHVVAGTREYFDVIARAGVFVNNVNFPNHLVKREGTIHVMTHHGTPLKRMGLDLRDTPIAGRRMNFEALLKRCERWDYSVAQNAFSTPIWERVYPTGFESLEVGYPRNDALALATEQDTARIRGELGIEPGQTAVLYTPTHREYQSGYVPVLDLARLADALGPDHVVLARLHYFYDADPHLRELHRSGRIRDVASYSTVEDLCLAADVLVTDYSSIMFDYAVLDRPIVIHAPDWEVYRALRGTYFDLIAEPPGVVARTEDELVEALTSRSAWGEEAARMRAAFRARFCSLDDGRAAERVVRRLWR
jgi:CDP-glycerol glycerophosphotransferase